MRILFLILLATQLKAQDDITVYEFDKVQMQINYRFENIELNLQRCHEQHRIGVGLVVAGIVANALAVPLILNYNPNAGILIGTGALLSLTGTGVILNSHKYIGRAGTR